MPDRAPVSAVGVAPVAGGSVGSVWAGRAALAGVLLGTAVRLARVLTTDFPLNDGGLFMVLVRDLQRAHYLLPATTSYNGGAIPFAYPPAGFYLVGLLNGSTHIGLVDLFRFLPAAISALTVYAFYRLARRLLAAE